MSVAAAVLLLLPFIPGLRSLPRRLGVYRLIWRQHYRTAAQTVATEDRRAAPERETVSA
jgi:hypothetical protein